MTVTEEQVQEQVANVVRHALRITEGGQQLGPDTALTSFGLDSLNIMDVLLGIEQTFGLTFDDADLDLTVLETVRSLSSFVRSRLN